MANFYIDDNGQIQAEQLVTAFETAAGETDEYGLSLADAPADSTVSVWLINSIRFKYEGFIKPEETAENGLLKFTCGVKPRSYTTEINSLDDYQEIKGWPFKNGYGSRFAQNSPQQNFVRYQFTWKPTRGTHLALNRLQDVIMTVQAIAADFNGSLEIYIRAKRGE